MKRIVFFCLVSLLLVCLCGCAEKDVELTVYYVEDGMQELFYSQALENYTKLTSERVIINTVTFETEEEMASTLENELAVNEGPDVILFSNNTTIDVNKAIKGYNFADIRKYIEKDEYISEDNYFMSIIDACETDGKQYIFPFSFNLSYLCTRASNIEVMDGIIGAASYDEFLDKLIAYQGDDRYANESSISLLFFDTAVGGETTFYDFLNIMGMNVYSEDNELMFNKEVLSGFYKLYGDIYKNQASVIKALEEPTLSKVVETVQTLVSYEIDSTYGIAHLNTYLEEDSKAPKFYSIPNNLTEGGTAFVDRYAVIDKGCDDVESAYELVKFLSGYSCNDIVNSTMLTNKTLYRKKTASIFDGFTTSERIWIKDLSKEMIAEYESIVNSVKHVVIANPSVGEIVNTFSDEYKSGLYD